jgi:hypothetical protein
MLKVMRGCGESERQVRVLRVMPTPGEGERGEVVVRIVTGLGRERIECRRAVERGDSGGRGGAVV